MSVALFALFLLALAVGLLLSYSAKKLHVPRDEQQQALLQALPGLNCGACGFPSCEGYAVALQNNQTGDLTLCPPGGHAAVAALERILEQKAGKLELQTAFVKCQGSPGYAKSDFHYEGLEDCQAAAQMFGGSKSCEYGCLGLGSCIKQCPVDAIHISADSLAVVDPNLCIGCRKCLPVCPTGVIQMIPLRAEYGVICNALDHGKITRGNCKVGCIGCRVCERKYPDLQFKVSKNLAYVDYQQLEEGGKAPDFLALADVMKKCPAKCIIPLGSGMRKMEQSQATISNSSQDISQDTLPTIGLQEGRKSPGGTPR